MSEGNLSTDEVLLPTIKVGGSAGIVGLFVGGTVGILRSSSAPLWAATTGFQWALLGSTYWGTRAALLRSRISDGQEQIAVAPQTTRKISAISGGFSAALVGGVLRGRATVVPGAIMGSLLGLLGQIGYDSLDKGHTQSLRPEHSLDPNSEQKDPLWKRAVNSRFSPVTLISDEDYMKTLQEKLMRVDVEIGIIDDDIAAIQIHSPNIAVQNK